MASQDLSSYDPNKIPDVQQMRIGIVVSEWNPEITNSLLNGALETLRSFGMQENQWRIHYAPGSFELPLACQWMVEQEQPNAVIAIGSVIRGETPHFDFVCHACSQGIMDVGLRTSTPIIFCVLTDDHIKQSRDRSGGKLGNKGCEAAVAAVKMAALKSRRSA
jgi:6,7-dimethyl-8-ribityllumazine synthase